MNQNNFRKHSCCFTGHRIEKLNEGEKEIKRLLEIVINNAIASGYTTFISGMATGTDIWASEIILEKKKSNNCLQLVCALPHPNFESGRSLSEKNRYSDIICNADVIREISNHYYRGCYQVRNKWMVDNSTLLIAVYNGQKGGTKNTIEYAKKQKITIVNVLD